MQSKSVRDTFTVFWNSLHPL